MFEASFQTAASTYRRMRAGIVEGEIISPVLFSLHANDLHSPSRLVDFPLYMVVTVVTVVIASSRQPALLVTWSHISVT
jgi:hypothetical protein